VATVPTWNAAEITNRLATAYANAQTGLNNGQYLVDFPGKELFCTFRDFLYVRQRG
jgi:hypothetical protein